MYIIPKIVWPITLIVFTKKKVTHSYGNNEICQKTIPNCVEVLLRTLMFLLYHYIYIYIFIYFLRWQRSAFFTESFIGGRYKRTSNFKRISKLFISYFQIVQALSEVLRTGVAHLSHDRRTETDVANSTGWRLSPKIYI